MPKFEKQAVTPQFDVFVPVSETYEEKRARVDANKVAEGIEALARIGFMIEQIQDNIALRGGIAPTMKIEQLRVEVEKARKALKA